MSVTALDSPAVGTITIRNDPRRPSAHDGLCREIDVRRYAEICGRCGAAIAPDAPVALRQRAYCAGRAKAITSCVSCAERWLAQQHPPQESCPHCRRPVYRRPHGRLFCCDRCAWLAASARRRARTAPRREKACAVCGRVFTASRVDARTCSSSCRQRDHRRRLGGTQPDHDALPTRLVQSGTLPLPIAHSQINAAQTTHRRSASKRVLVTKPAS